MTVKGIDIAWARPDVDGIKATGAKWVARYFSPDPTKNITKAEVAAYAAAKLGIVTVFEGSAGNATKGRSQGIKDAELAVTNRKTVGLPGDHVIYFAVDLDTTWDKVSAYFDGVTSVINKKLVGIYGGYKIIQAAHAAGYGFLWQTVAWSNGHWSPYADIRQTGGTVLSGGADVDYADTPDFGQYPSPITPAKPVPPATTSTKVPDMLIITVDKTDKATPKGAAWPGDFLVLDTAPRKLLHIKSPEDEAKLTSKGVPGPFTVSYADYQDLLTGK